MLHRDEECVDTCDAYGNGSLHRKILHLYPSVGAHPVFCIKVSTLMIFDVSLRLHNLQ